MNLFGLVLIYFRGREICNHFQKTLMKEGDYLLKKYWSCVCNSKNEAFPPSMENIVIAEVYVSTKVQNCFTSLDNPPCNCGFCAGSSSNIIKPFLSSRRLVNEADSLQTIYFFLNTLAPIVDVLLQSIQMAEAGLIYLCFF